MRNHKCTPTNTTPDMSEAELSELSVEELIALVIELGEQNARLSANHRNCR